MATAAPLPGPPPTELADHVLEIPSSIDIGPGGDQLLCFVIDPQFTEDVPGNAAIVHHALVRRARLHLRQHDEQPEPRRGAGRVLAAPIDVFLGEETLDEMCLAASYEGP